MMKRRLILSAIAAALLAAGCASPLANARTWKGRFALRSEKENLSGRFELTDAPGNFRGSHFHEESLGSRRQGQKP